MKKLLGLALLTAVFAANADYATGETDVYDQDQTMVDSTTSYPCYSCNTGCYGCGGGYGRGYGRRWGGYYGYGRPFGRWGGGFGLGFRRGLWW